MRQLAPLPLLALLACQADDEDTDDTDSPACTPAEGPLSGTVAGQPWMAAAGETDDFLSDEEELYGIVYGEADTACDYSSPSGPRLLLGVPREVGTYEMGLMLNATFSYDDGTGTWQNLVATTGVVRVDEVTETSVSGAACFDYDDDNDVSGIFELVICAE